MITRETDYAIRALLYLAQQEEGALVSTTVLAEAMDIPYRFLRRIVLRLVESGLASSARGKQGGLRLGRPAATISLFDILHAVDPDAATLNQCLGGEFDCPRSPSCVVHVELGRIQERLHAELAGVSLASLATRARRNP
jgi:Rrf2 family iron-responsive transcriptional regulator